MPRCQVRNETKNPGFTAREQRAAGFPSAAWGLLRDRAGKSVRAGLPPDVRRIGQRTGDRRRPPGGPVRRSPTARRASPPATLRATALTPVATQSGITPISFTTVGPAPAASTVSSASFSAGSCGPVRVCGGYSENRRRDRRRASRQARRFEVTVSTKITASVSSRYGVRSSPGVPTSITSTSGAGTRRTPRARE